MGTCLVRAYLSLCVVSFFLHACGAASPSDYAASDFAVAPSTVPADGRTQGIISLVVKDPNKAPVAGVSVKIRASDATSIIITSQSNRRGWPHDGQHHRDARRHTDIDRAADLQGRDDGAR